MLLSNWQVEAINWIISGVFSLDIQNKYDNDIFINEYSFYYEKCFLNSATSEQEELLKFLYNCSRDHLTKWKFSSNKGSSDIYFYEEVDFDF